MTRQHALMGLGLAIVVAAASEIAGWTPGDLIGAARAGDAPAASGLVLPKMDSRRGRELYVSKGCVACHAMNGVGGTNGVPLDAATMDPARNPFEFFARMWVGTKPMIEMQEKRMGGQVDMSAQELGDIVAFIHDPAMQKSFSAAEIPDKIEDLIE